MVRIIFIRAWYSRILNEPIWIQILIIFKKRGIILKTKIKYRRSIIKIEERVGKTGIRKKLKKLRRNEISWRLTEKRKRRSSLKIERTLRKYRFVLIW